MDQLSEIEAIVLSQKWKKTKATIRKSLSNLPVPTFKHSGKSTPALAGIEKLSEICIQNFTSQDSSPLRIERVKELAKLAVPFGTLKEAISRVNARPQDTLVPAFPMRHFGCASKCEPMFEKVNAKIGPMIKKQKMQYIKRRYGRMSINNLQKLPSISSTPTLNKNNNFR